MAILQVLKYPHENLRKMAEPVLNIDDNIKKLVQDMFETMYALNGVGLAATQVNQHVRVVVIDISEERNQPIVLINPVITAQEGMVQGEEGCLSLPGIYETVTRAERVKVTAINLDEETFSLEADGLLSRCIQHELDHLQGKVFVNYLSRLKQNRVKTKLIKQSKIREKAQ
ncbi:MAG: peptide deformylase [Francisella sp.]|nr:MAG: peptide deformylase [Francisella sp.]